MSSQPLLESPRWTFNPVVPKATIDDPLEYEVPRVVEVGFLWATPIRGLVSPDEDMLPCLYLDRAQVQCH
jgi:hypothetical protein